jgi:protein O-mannosyl-transferase
MRPESTDCGVEAHDPAFRISYRLGVALVSVCLLLSQWLVPSTSGEAQSSSEALSHLTKGQQALESHHLNEAKEHFQRALKADPSLAEAQLFLGIAEFQAGENPAAIRHFGAYLELHPDSFDGHYNLALACLREQNIEEGQRHLEQALSLNPRHTDAAYNLAVVLLERGRGEEALLRLRGLPKSRPDVAYHLIRAELLTGHFDEATQEASLGAKNFSKDVAWTASVGQLFLSHGQSREAIKHLTAAWLMQPGSDEIRRSLAAAYVEGREPDKALALLKAATGGEDRYLAASALLLQRRLPEALEETLQALKQDPREPRYLLQKARIIQRLGRHLESLEILQQVSQSQPRWAEPHYSSGVSYYLLRRYDEARRSLGQALELDPRSRRGLFLYAATLANEGKNAEGEQYLLRAMALDPSDARFHYHLGAMRLRDNRPEDARRSFEDAIRLKADYALPHYQLGKLLASSNQLQLAARELETAVRCQPDLAQAFYHLGRVYARLGEAEKSTRALASFQQFKQEAANEDREFMENIQKELEF